MSLCWILLSLHSHSQNFCASTHNKYLNSQCQVHFPSLPQWLVFILLHPIQCVIQTLISIKISVVSCCQCTVVHRISVVQLSNTSYKYYGLIGARTIMTGSKVVAFSNIYKKICIYSIEFSHLQDLWKSNHYTPSVVTRIQSLLSVWIFLVKGLTYPIGQRPGASNAHSEASGFSKIFFCILYEQIKEIHNFVRQVEKKKRYVDAMPNGNAGTEYWVWKLQSCMFIKFPYIVIKLKLFMYIHVEQWYLIHLNLAIKLIYPKVW